MERIAEISKDDAFRLAIMERDTETHPTNIQKRFAVAYKHSENDNKDMALHHYMKIPVLQRDGTTWNNIGVSYGEFQMPVKGVAAFRRGAEAGETLAMSNLGNKFLNAGFLEEADAQCKKALAMQEFDKAVPLLLKRLTETQEEEAKKLKDAIEAVKSKAAFYRQLGKCVILETPTIIAPKWTSGESALGAQLNNEALRLFGTYERPANALARALAPSLTSQNVTYRIEYTGRMWGRMFSGTVIRTRDGLPTSLLDEIPTKTLMFLSEDESELNVMENYTSISPSFYVLRRHE